MAKQTIINTPINSGEGDSLNAAFTKVNENFDELYTAITISGTSQLVNDSGFLTVDDLPTEYPMSAITSLVSSLASISSALSGLSATTSTNASDILTIQGDINTINSSIGTINSTLNAQNLLISSMQQQITDIINQIS